MKLKLAQQMWEDSKKDVKADEKQLEADYIQKKTDFLRVKDLIMNMSNVLDLEMPDYVFEEDKSKQTHIVISKKAPRVDLEKNQAA